MMQWDRRQLIGGAAAGGMLLLLPACQSLPGISLTEAIRRLLTVASQDAFATLVAENGFFADDVARLSLPEYLGGSRVTSIASLLLRTPAVQDRLLRQVNRAAEKGAELAAPIVAEAVRSMTINDALSIVNGGPDAATALLQRQLGASLIGRMAPGIERGLRLFDDEVINLALRELTNINFARLRDDISDRASSAIYRAIGAQEARIRANPQSTNDPLLIAVFGLR